MAGSLLKNTYAEIHCGGSVGRIAMLRASLALP
jgi:hypothetical protein